MSESSFSLPWKEAYAGDNCQSAEFAALAHKYEKAMGVAAPATEITVVTAQRK